LGINSNASRITPNTNRLETRPEIAPTMLFWAIFLLVNIVNMANKKWALGQAVEITKEYSRGGGDRYPSTILEEVYQKLIVLSDHSDS